MLHSHDVYCIHNILNNGYIFTSGYDYKLRLEININNEHFYQSSSTNIIGNNLELDGSCRIDNIDNLVFFDEFNFICSGWTSQYKNNDIKYNALINGVKISSTYVDNSQLIEGIVGAGDVHITVLIKNE